MVCHRAFEEKSWGGAAICPGVGEVADSLSQLWRSTRWVWPLRLKVEVTPRWGLGGGR